jgi:hypothetical protein
MAVSLTGTAVSEPIPNIVVAPSTYNFGNVVVGTSSEASEVTVSNVGIAALHISSIGLSSSTDFTLDATPVGTTPCGGEVEAGGSCTVTVTFTPTSTGSKTATLTIVSDDPDTPEVSVSLTGRGVSELIRLVVSAGEKNQVSGSAEKTDVNVPMLQISLKAETEDTVVTSITFTGSGSGNEKDDLSAVRLYQDADGDGEVSAGDRELGEGVYSKDNGKVTFSGLNEVIVRGESETLLLVYDFNVQESAAASSIGLSPQVGGRVPFLLLAALASVFFILALGILAHTRRKGYGVGLALIASAVVLISSGCNLLLPTTTGGPATEVTFRVGIQSSDDIVANGGSSGEIASPEGDIPVEGRTVTVER